MRLRANWIYLLRYLDIHVRTRAVLSVDGMNTEEFFIDYGWIPISYEALSTRRQSLHVWLQQRSVHSPMSCWNAEQGNVTEHGDQNVDFCLTWTAQVGLLLPDNDQMVASAYERYLDTSPPGQILANKFKRAFSIHCHIEFLGVW